MKTGMQEKIDRYVGWGADALETRIKWRLANMKADQQEIAAMQKARRIQRKREKAPDGPRVPIDIEDASQ